MKSIRKYLVVLLLLAYAGQALVAIASPCAMMTSAGTAVDRVDMPAMAHAGHQMPAAADTMPAPSAGDCCDGGLCTMSHCQSATALPLSYFGNSPQYTSLYTLPADNAAPFHPVDSLYRPPISR